MKNPLIIESIMYVMSLSIVGIALPPTSVLEMEPVSRNTLSGEGYDESTGMAMDSHGSIILAGTFRNSLDFDPGSGTHVKTASGSDEFGFFGKYDSDGNLEWVHVYKSYLRGNTKHGDISVDSEDNIVVTGICKGTVDLGFGANGGVIPSVSGWAAFVAKYGPNGDFKWAVPITPSSGTGYPKPEQIEVSGNGDILLSGTFSGKIDFDPSEEETVVESNEAYASGFVAKYTADGALGWVRDMPNAGKVLVASSPDNKVGIAGTFFDSTTISEGQMIYPDSRFETPNNHGMFAGGLEPNGDYGWLTEFGVSTSTFSDEDVADVKVDENGKTYVVGRYHGEFRVGDIVLSDTLRYQLYWISFDGEGAVQTALSHAFDSWPKGVQVTVDGTLYVAGNVNEDTLGGIADPKLFLSRYSSSDTVVWVAANAEETKSDNVVDFVLLDNHNVLFAGYVYDPELPDRDPVFSSWSLPEPAFSTNDLLWMKPAEASFLRGINGRALQIRGIGSKSNLIVTDVAGNRVLVSPVSSTGITPVPLTSLSSGVYLVYLRTADYRSGVRTIRLMER